MIQLVFLLKPCNPVEPTVIIDFMANRNVLMEPLLGPNRTVSANHSFGENIFAFV